MADVPDAPAQGLTIGVLGPLSVRLDGRPVQLGGRRQAAVLVALVLGHGRVVSVDALAEAVWPDSPPAAPQPALHAHISHLRKRLDPQGAPGLRTGAIERVGPGYALRLPEDAVDAWRFESLVTEPVTVVNGHDPAIATIERLSHALSLWRGAAVAEYADEEWARPTVHRWTELHAVARERLCGARLERGESAVLVPELESFVAEAPLREERWRLLVLALYRAHRQADALAALRRVRDLLADELGVDPGPVLRSLESEILAQSDSLDASSGGPSHPNQQQSRADTLVSPPSLPPPVVGGDTDIVERDDDLASIAEAVGSALDGDGRVVLIEGPAGIGKTRLLREVRARATGARVLAARGSQLEKEYGYGVVRQLFEPIVAGADQAALFAGAAGPSRGVFTSHTDPAAPAGDSTFAVLHGLYWLTADLAANGAIVITVDDVQWCDVGSLRFLGFLAHRLEGLPVALVVTLRTGEEHDNDDLLAEIISEASVLVVSPRPLSGSGVSELVRDRLGEHPDEGFVAACRRSTGGNPLLLRQLLRALESDGIKPTASNVDTVRAIGSRAVSSMVLRRFTRMPPESRAAARAVAILGDGASLPTVAELTGLPQPAVAEAMGSLARAEVLRPEYPLDFVHPLVRDAVYNDIPLGTREMQHEQAARILTLADASPEQVAAQLLKSPPRGDQQAVQTLLTAAARSATRGAPDGAVTYLRRALAEPPDPALAPQLHLELGRVETLTDVPAALEHLTIARERLTDVRERAHAAVMLGRVEIFAGARGTSRETAESIIAQLPAQYDDERQWLQAISRISSHMHALGAPPGPLPQINGIGPGALSLATTTAWEITLAGVERQQAIDLARLALSGEILDSVDQGFMGSIARNVLEVAEASPPAQWDDALAKAYRKGDLFAVLGAQVWGGYARWHRGELDEALQWLRNCTEQNDLWGAHQIGQTYTDAFMVEVLLDRGEIGAAQALLDKDQPYWQLVSEGQALLLTARARALFHRGLPGESLAVLGRVGELSLGIENPAWRSWQTDRAVVLAAAGERAEAEELLRTDLGYARRWGTSRALGRTLRLLGTLLGPAGVDEIRESVVVLETGSARLELAKAKAALGESLAATHGAAPAEAVDALRSACLLAAECSAVGLEKHIGDLLNRHGVAAPATARRKALTTTERSMVQMSLDGAFDQEIAQALFITTQTVRQTLDAVRSRYQVTSPGELAELLATR